MPRRSKLTEAERVALDGPFNLADGHARNTLEAFWESYGSVDQSRLSRTSQTTLEERFVTAFGQTLGQRIDAAHRCTVILPSASLSVEVATNLLRLRRAQTMLAPEPCFDNLIDIFRRHGVRVLPYASEEPTLPALLELITRDDVSAVLVVIPGNPTGTLDTFAELTSIVDACGRWRKLLIVDASFRAFSSEHSAYDCYALLDASECEYLVVEDTGKFLATHELKASILSASQTLAANVRDIYQDIMLGQSPITLQLLSDTLARLDRGGVDDIRQLAAENSRDLCARLPLFLTRRSTAAMGVLWLELHGAQDSDELVAGLATAGLHILSGSLFYWSGNMPTGRRRVRVALVRDRNYFMSAIEPWVSTS